MSFSLYCDFNDYYPDQEDLTEEEIQRKIDLEEKLHSPSLELYGLCRSDFL